MTDPPPVQRVVVTDIDIPFQSMLTLIVKLCLASIPAAIVLGFLALVAAAILGGLTRF